MFKKLPGIQILLMILFSGTMCFTLLPACKKQNSNNNSNNGGNNGAGDSIVVPADPGIANTIGFFMNDWQPKNFTAPAYTDTVIPASAVITVTADASTILTKISPCLFGNNVNPYITQIVTQPTLMGYLNRLHPKIIRFPGGNISSVYFWNAAQGNPPSDAPGNLVDANGNKIDAGYWYGKNTDGWTLSIDNYYSMLQQTGNEGMITVNYAYARYGIANDPVAAAAHLAADWVRYDKGRTKYWEIGNESGGTWQAGYCIDTLLNKDHQPEIITGDLYGKHFKVFADSMHQAANEISATIYIGAQLIDQPPASWATETDKTWNAGMMTEAGSIADFFIVHDYFTPYNTNSSAADILASASSVPKSAINYLNQSVQSAGIAMKPVALTEWNIFATGSQQMVSSIAGMHAVLVINELMKNKFGMDSRWDLANGWDNGNDQGMFSQGGEAGVPLWNPRPVFYYMYFFQKFLGDRFINASVSGSSSIAAYASTFSSGQLGVTLVNQSTSAQTIKLAFKNFNAGNRFYWYSLTGGNDNGEFSRKVYVNGQGPPGVAGGPANYALLKAYSSSAGNGTTITLLPISVVCMVIDKK